MNFFGSLLRRAIGAAALAFVLAFALAAAAQTGPGLSEPPRAPQKPVPNAAPAPLNDLQRADRLARRGELDAALTAVDKHLAGAPDDVPGRFLRGVILTDLKRTDEAMRIFTELTLQHPQLPEPFNNLAVIYAEAGNLERARAALEHAVSANPANGPIRENLGDVYVRLAEAAYERAAKLQPNRGALRAKLQAVRALAATPATSRGAAADPPSPSSSPTDGVKQ